MTEKRFGMFKSKVTGLYVPVDKMKVYNFSGIEEEYDCMRFIKVLNDLEERGTINGKLASKLLEENEQLKQFKEDVFVLLDEKIKHYEHKPFSAPVGQPMSVNFDADMDRLARLSELQQLKEELKVMWND